MVAVGTMEVPVKEIKMDQDGNKMDVSLWRQHADANITIGQHIELENMVIRKWNNNNNTANSTYRTVLRVITAVLKISEIFAHPLQSYCT